MQKKLNECEIGGRYVVSGVQVDESITIVAQLSRQKSKIFIMN